MLHEEPYSLKYVERSTTRIRSGMCSSRARHCGAIYLFMERLLQSGYFRVHILYPITDSALLSWHSIWTGTGMICRNMDACKCELGTWARVAQSVERKAFNLVVVTTTRWGSNPRWVRAPPRAHDFCIPFYLVERFTTW